MYIKSLESEVKSSHQMVIKAVWPNYMIFFIPLIFNVQVETFEDFGSSGFTECTSITHSQNSFPVHYTSRFTDSRTPKMVDLGVMTISLLPPPSPWFRLERSRWVLTRSFNVIHKQIYMQPGVWYMYPYQGDFQTKLFLDHFSNNFD